MDKVDKIWMNGRLIDWDDANVHFLTQSFHYGTGVFEGIRCYSTKKGPAVFRLQEHVKRLHDSAKILGMNVPYTAEQSKKAIIETIKANKLKECYIRPMIYYDYGVMGINVKNSKVGYGIAVWKWGKYLGEEGVKNGISAKISSFSRHHVNVMMTKAKICGNYPNSTLAKMEAVNDGYDEAILLDTQGFVSECSGENIFIVRAGVVYTPPKAAILEGITRDSVMTIAKDLGIEV
ncbi:branched-chain amino acid transaminase, partial [Candidatus Woesearchaeota archaeon]|nr:branched-chain amino acid transaminase [Candidatus Woesearchaeota archaeon]